MPRRAPSRFPELSYASPGQPRLKRWFIRGVEHLSGRERYARLYDHWRREIAPTGDRIFGRMLDLVGVGLDAEGQWPPADLPDGPLVIVANHPFGIGDGIAILSLVERLGRPFRVMINAELLKVPEMAPYSLPIDFSESRQALVANLAVRNEALKLLSQGTVIVVFPGGGVATAPRGFSRAVDLPWKMFPARMVQEAKASVVPIWFGGQNGRLFHVVSGPMALAERDGRLARAVGGLSLTLRTSLLIREFTRLSGRTIKARIGPTLKAGDLAACRDRRELTRLLHAAVFGLAPARPRAREAVQGAAAPSAAMTSTS
ncbi:MAG: 1-acyl-sn-glycerol-3-phosphate acyltransferase [Rhizobiaceae bacterium]|nr:1-acyl-sn-glycerol-3-phosphate acyltransferase [Rhizobiaceae bacterium]MCV0408818.1 1-acyl-sn-glycerol-3-phosphate acyltransferase [Rhizobiaceae bacterium]